MEWYIIPLCVLLAPLALLFALAGVAIAGIVLFQLIVMPWWIMLHALRIVKTAPPSSPGAW